MSILARFARDEHGATAVEYGLILTGIAMVIVVAMPTLAGKLNGVFNSVSTALK